MRNTIFVNFSNVKEVTHCFKIKAVIRPEYQLLKNGCLCYSPTKDSIIPQPRSRWLYARTVVPACHSIALPHSFLFTRTLGLRQRQLRQSSKQRLGFCETKEVLEHDVGNQCKNLRLVVQNCATELRHEYIVYRQIVILKRLQKMEEYAIRYLRQIFNRFY